VVARGLIEVEPPILASAALMIRSADVALAHMR
jgi:hypothetical protein